MLYKTQFLVGLYTLHTLYISDPILTNDTFIMQTPFAKNQTYLVFTEPDLLQAKSDKDAVIIKMFSLSYEFNT